MALVNKCSDGVECSDEEHQAKRRTEFKSIEVLRSMDKGVIQSEAKNFYLPY